MIWLYGGGTMAFLLVSMVGLILWRIKGQLHLLVLNPAGKISHAKFFTTLGSFVLIWVFVVDFLSHGETTWEKMAGFGAIFVGNQLGSKYLDIKGNGGGANGAPEPEAVK